MALHPQARRYLDELAGHDGSGPLPEQRAEARAAALAEPDRIGLDLVEDLEADGVPVRLYRPRLGAPLALYVHGGGWVMHDLETHDAFCRYLAHATGWALLAVDYRRAPEHPFPAPLDDVETVARWIRADGLAALRVDTAFVAGIGDSSGANLIAATSVRDPDLLDGSVLIYPAIDRGGELDPEVENAALDAESMTWFWDQYADGVDRDDPEVSPARSDRLDRFARTLVVTAEHDVLAAQGRSFAAALADAGVPVTAWQIDGMIHSFWRQPEVFDASRSLIVAVGALLDQWRFDSERGRE